MTHHDLMARQEAPTGTCLACMTERTPRSVASVGLYSTFECPASGLQHSHPMDSDLAQYDASHPGGGDGYFAKSYALSLASKRATFRYGPKGYTGSSLFAVGQPRWDAS